VNVPVGFSNVFLVRRRIVWLEGSSQQQPMSLSIAYQQVVMHAVAADEDSGNRQCVYLQLDEGSEGMDMGEDEDDDAEAELAAEVRFVPEDPSQGVCRPSAPCAYDSYLYWAGLRCASTLYSVMSPHMQFLLCDGPTCSNVVKNSRQARC
jgi:hypothetical protein